MGKDYCGSWLHQQHSPWQTLNFKCTNGPSDPGLQNTISPSINPRINMVSANGALQGIGVSGLPNIKIAQANEWLHRLPRNGHGLTLAPNSTLQEKFSAFPYGGCGIAPTNVGVSSGSVQKRFLVFDQSGNHTSLIFSSVIGTPHHPASYGTPKPFDTSGVREEVLEIKRDPFCQISPVISDRLDEMNHENSEGSEMHEDSEELDALLYSDGDTDDDDEEETSTGHSPIEQEEGSTEEVASSGRPTKRQRLLLDGEHDESVMDTACSGKPNGTWEYVDDDAELSCTNGRILDREEMGSSCGNKRKRKERIRETVSILRKIIPGGKGKEAVFVLDEAIRYLTYLKLKAKALDATTTL